jgi:hypothetical protein
MAIEHMVKAMPVTAVIQTPKAKITADKVDSPTLRTKKSGDGLFAQSWMTVSKLLRPLYKSGGVCLNGNWLDIGYKHHLV